MKKEIAKIALILLGVTLLAWGLMALGTYLLWQVDWRVAVGVWLFIIGYALEQAVAKTKEKWRL